MISLWISVAGAKWWYKDNDRHRVNGPAAVYLDGFCAWWRYGLLHRTDGPARIWADGHADYWVNGNQVTAYESMFINRSGHD